MAFVQWLCVYGYVGSRTRLYTDGDGNAHTSVHTYWSSKGSGLFTVY